MSLSHPWSVGTTAPRSWDCRVPRTTERSSPEKLRAAIGYKCPTVRRGAVA